MKCWFVNLWESIAASISAQPPVKVTCVEDTLRVENRWYFEVEVEVADFSGELPKYVKLGVLRSGEWAEARCTCKKAAVFLRHPCKSLLPITKWES
ncbi:MAG: hypothetical protein QXP31_00370 [Pyrobaculum sp.]